MNKKELAKFDSLQKWLQSNLVHYVLDDETTVTWDSEDAGFISMFFDCNDDYWAIGFDCSSGDKYCIADMNDCEDMTLAEIKRDLKDRIEVYKQIKWS
jgi:hypothetical protein